jgi:sarcosine/dimethylglycine N-methyltransferase
MTSGSPSLRDLADVYAEPGMHLWLRLSGPHLHGGSEDATVALAARAEAFGLRPGGRIVELASALGGPSRYVARRFVATVLCIDGDPRMQRAARASHEAEGLWLRCLPLLARTEHLPLADASCDAAWSQDALCHMDKPAVVREAARVLGPGALFAFTDFIARVPLTAEEQAELARLWAFPALLRVSEYVCLLDESGFDVLLGEDRTPATPPRAGVRPADEETWQRDFVGRYGEEEVARQYARIGAWRALLEAGRGGYGMFIARRRDVPAGA